MEPALRVTKIFVGGLPPACEDADLREHFAQFGTITESLVCDELTSHILIIAILRQMPNRSWWIRAPKRAGKRSFRVFVFISIVR